MQYSNKIMIKYFSKKYFENLIHPKINYMIIPKQKI